MVAKVEVAVWSDRATTRQGLGVQDNPGRELENMAAKVFCSFLGHVTGLSVNLAVVVCSQSRKLT